MLKETNTINQVVLKGHYILEEFKAKFGKIYEEILYMPLITGRTKNIIEFLTS